MITLIFYKDNIGHYFSDFLQLLEDRHVGRSTEQVSEEHSEMEEREPPLGGGKRRVWKLSRGTISLI